MKTIFQKLVSLGIAVLVFTPGYGQTKTNNTNDKEPLPVLKGDTLYFNDGVKIFVGQVLNVGKPSGVDGQFRAIISKKAAIVPSIWGQDKRFEYAIENYADSKKSKEKLTQFLLSVKVLTIKKIILTNTGKPYFYMVVLSSEKDECKADIQLALKCKELLLQP